MRVRERHRLLLPPHDGRRRDQQARLSLHDFRGQLPQRRHVQYPEGPAMRGDHEVVGRGRLGELVNRDRRQPRRAVDLCPRRPAIDRREAGELGSEIEQVRVGDVFPKHPRRSGRQVRLERLPGLAVVLGHEDIRRIIVRPVGVEDDVAAAIRPLRRLDARHPSRAGQAGGDELVRQVRPGFATVPREPDGPVVGAGPEFVRVPRRLGQGGASAALGAADLGETACRSSPCFRDRNT